MSHSASNQPSFMVFWFIWFSIFCGLIILQILLGGGIPSGVGRGDAPVVFQILGTGAAAASLGLRFIAIPRVRGLDKKLPLMIVGLALAEAVGIMGMLVVSREHGDVRLFLFGMALVCIVLSAPVYARPAQPGNPFVNDPGS